MSSVVVTTDFTDAGNNAVHYAAGLAASLQLPLQVVHTFLVLPIMYNMNMDMPLPVTPVEELRQEAQQEMDKLKAAVQAQHPNLAVTYTLAYGSDTDGVEEAAEKAGPLIAVIGYETDEKLWTGEEAPATMKDLNIPVLAVPSGGAWQSPQQICVACDAAMLSHPFPIATLKKVAQNEGLAVHLLHVSPGHLEREQYGYDGSVLQQSLAGHNVQFHIATSVNTEDAIARFAETNGADWLVIMPHHHGFIEGLFHRSHTKALLQRLRIPVLALHNEAGKQ